MSSQTDSKSNEFYKWNMKCVDAVLKNCQHEKNVFTVQIATPPRNCMKWRDFFPDIQESARRYLWNIDALYDDIFDFNVDFLKRLHSYISNLVTEKTNIYVIPNDAEDIEKLKNGLTLNKSAYNAGSCNNSFIDICETCGEIAGRSERIKRCNFITVIDTINYDINCYYKICTECYFYYLFDVNHDEINKSISYSKCQYCGSNTY